MGGKSKTNQTNEVQKKKRSEMTGYELGQDTLQRHTEKQKELREASEHHYHIWTTDHTMDAAHHYNKMEAQAEAVVEGLEYYCDLVEGKSDTEFPLDNTYYALRQRDRAQRVALDEFTGKPKGIYSMSALRSAFDRFSESDAFKVVCGNKEEPKNPTNADEMMASFFAVGVKRSEKLDADRLRNLQRVHTRDMLVLIALGGRAVEQPVGAELHDPKWMDNARLQGMTIMNLHTQVNDLYQRLKDTDSIFSHDSTQYKTMKKELKATRDMLNRAVRGELKPDDDLNAQLAKVKQAQQAYEQARGPLKYSDRREARRSVAATIALLPNLNDKLAPIPAGPSGQVFKPEDEALSCKEFLQHCKGKTFFENRKKATDATKAIKNSKYPMQKEQADKERTTESNLQI